MYPGRMKFFVVGVLLIFALALAACDQEPEEVEVTRVVQVTSEPEEVTVEVTRVVEVPAEPEGPEAPEAVAQLSIIDQWQNSPHADASAEAFVHWDEDDPAEVPTSCAKCHSTPGFIDFLGADGTEAGTVDQAAPIGSVVECEACHNDAAQELTTVTFPSGETVSQLADEARCMQCHQGRASTVQVNEAIADAAQPDDPDAVDEELGFVNIHYYAAAATKYGTWAKGGYEYEGKSYDALFDHVEPFDTCIDCHDPHTLEVQVDSCSECHTNVNSPEDLAQIRTEASLVDYDGDGDMDEGVLGEIETLQAMLYEAMQTYTADVVEMPILYDSASYPYFFVDSNANREADEGEIAFDNQFTNWTPRLLKAAYNYQVSLKDPGQYAHGGKYIIQLLYDSIEDLNQALDEPMDIDSLRRIDHGHFAGSEEAFRHWDEDGFVPASCSKCHSADGLPLMLTEGVAISQELSNGLECTTCHTNLETYERFEVEEVEFPSGAVLSTGDSDSNLCLNCHQGRESTVSVNRTIGDTPDDETSENLRFLNVHYFAAGATLFGAEAQGAYQFEGQEYMGRFEHVPAFDSCNECHDTHALEVEVQACSNCHTSVNDREDLVDIRFPRDDFAPTDYDGDGDVEEGIAREIETLHEMLYEALQTHAAEEIGTGIVYDSHSYPYFFVDTNENREADPDEINFGNAFNSWTPRLLRAAYNYQYVAKDPGAFAHNNEYIIQILYDSLNHLGADVSGLVRP